ncbi:HlyD family efflux transporter periplasmic adaptor subunit [uncultured Gimesia sp.]|uniref:HlyD family efflux transporter periplasmic adaptor subunit n=1 Tax=uncultured Gimesia sp. TaxID=1678688 RepID=UPI00263801C9|nr:HlyD family efflux transporter periplasmic adaptor subunit [uncultured Gimesia sp.]
MKPRRRLPSKTKLLFFAVIALGITVLIVPALRTPLFSVFASGAKKNTTYITDKATQGPFRVTVTERGQLDSLNNVTLTNKVKGFTTIISIVPEGTMVKAGDLVCELDSALLVDKEKQQQIQVTQAEAELKQAEENVAIQRTQNDSDNSAAELALKLARLDLNKFKEGESQRDLNVKEGAITKSREDLQRAEENFEFSKRIAKKGYKSQNDVEADRINVVKAEIDLEIAKEDLKVEKEYVQNRKLIELEADVKEKERNLERVERKGVATLAQFDAKLNASQLTYEVEKSELERMREQILVCKMVAPQNGQVVYANQGSGRRSSGEDVIEEGTEVRERQAIIQLPDFTQMKVDARIHESKISMIQQGLRVNIRVDAFPEQLYIGEVDVVSSVPISSNWMRPDLKEYKATIKIHPNGADITKLKPGLTAEIEILIESRDNVLQVPVQSVITIGDHRYIFVLNSDGTTEQREIKIGQAGDTMIEILDGVKKGDEVILNPRTHFADELIDLEEQLAIEKKKEAGVNGGDQSEAGSAPKTTPGGGDKPAGQAAEKKKPAGGGGDPAAFLKRLDKDADGKVSKEEAPERMQEIFDTLDANKDGFLDAEELKNRKPPSGGAGGPRPAGESRP